MSVLEQKNIPLSSAFVWRKPGFPLGYAFFCNSIRKYTGGVCGISDWITDFQRKTAAVNRNSQQKLYKYSASAIFRRFRVVSAELPAILEKNFRPGRCNLFVKSSSWNLLFSLLSCDAIRISKSRISSLQKASPAEEASPSISSLVLNTIVFEMRREEALRPKSNLGP